MKILKWCHECSNNGEKDNAAVLTITNDTVYTVVCDKGHSQKVSLPHLKHEVLFEFGVSAIVDGYYREAISSFAAALERYYEHFIRVIFIGRNIDSFDQAWKEVKSQSERQLGAYIFIHLYTLGVKPELLSNKMTQTRNNAIHKGLIPTKEEAIEFGFSVAKIINTGNDNLHKHFSKQLEEVLRQVLFPGPSTYDNGIHVNSMYLSSLCSHELMDLKEYVASKETHNRAKY